MNRYEAKNMKNHRFDYTVKGIVIGYTAPIGFGIFDNEVGKFVALSSASDNQPTVYKKKSTVKIIVDAFNTVGPSGEIFYANEK